MARKEELMSMVEDLHEVGRSLAALQDMAMRLGMGVYLTVSVGVANGKCWVMVNNDPKESVYVSDYSSDSGENWSTIHDF